MSPPATIRTPRKTRALLLVALAALAPLVALAGTAAAQTSEPEHQPPPEEWTWREEPAREEWTWREPTFARIALRLEPSELRLVAGETARATYVATNEGDAAADVRVTLSRHFGRDGVDARIASGGEHALAPGESARGVVEIHASRGASGVQFLHLEAQAVPRNDDVIALTSIALLHIEVVPQQPEPQPCARAWGWLRVPAFGAPHCWRAVPAPMLRPVPPPFVMEPDAPHMLVPFERAPAPQPWRHEPPTMRSDGTLLLHLVLHGRIEGGRLVIDLDDTLRALLAPAIVRGEARVEG